VKKRWVLLCLMGMLFYTKPVWATPFPDKTQEVVQDEDGYIKESERERFAEVVQNFPGQYKIVVVESTQPEAQSPDEYAHKLYDNYNLSDDTLMVVLDINTEELGAYAGPALQQKGATPELLREKITAYYDPYRIGKDYLKGIELFITELHKELNSKQGNSEGTAVAPTDDASQKPASQEEPGWMSVPWWLYGIGLLFVVLSAGLVYALFRRRAIFAQVDEVEEKKDELVEKINMIEVEKSLRRATGMTEERFLQLANRKESLLRIRIPDVEMMILDAEESCDRFRFQLALGILEEARETLSSIEQELAELKTDTTKVVTTKQENRLVIPEIGKQVEQVERRLSDMRLEYGLSFHELKTALDEVEAMRAQVKEARAAGDDVRAYETTLRAQEKLAALATSLEQIPPMFNQVTREMPEELKQLQEGITQAIGSGYDLDEHVLEGSLLQAKQLLIAARNALEDGSLELAGNQVKAFEVLLDTTYQTIEEMVLAQRQAAASTAEAVPDIAEEVVSSPEIPASTVHPEEWVDPSDAAVDEAMQPVEGNVEVYEEPDEPEVPAVHERQEVLAAAPQVAAAMTREEREVLLEATVDVGKRAEETCAEPERVERHAGTPFGDEEEPEYELVIPRQQAETEAAAAPERLLIETEDDALDEMERISNTLVRIRQHIKRSYLPGLPDQLKYLFEEVVHHLAQTQAIMETHNYDLEEVSMLLNDAHELLLETEKLAERTIQSCQLAEGAIQYTNRYRRQNRRVNELLSKAEQAFRHLSFAEAYQLAEEARLVIEGEQGETDKGWLLRRKKKG